MDEQAVPDGPKPLLFHDVHYAIASNVPEDKSKEVSEGVWSDRS
jgi:hypothetical protein